MQAGAVAGDDEQRVVDADADADDRRDLGREVGHGQHARYEADDRGATTDAEQRGQDRQPHGEERAEGDEEDDDRGDEADDLAGELGLLREEVAAKLHLQALRRLGLYRLVQVFDHLGIIDVLLVVAVGEVDLRVGNLAAWGDLVGVLRLVRAYDLHSLEATFDVGEELLHDAADGGIIDALLCPEHDLAGEASAFADALSRQ